MHPFVNRASATTIANIQLIRAIDQKRKAGRNPPFFRSNIYLGEN